MPNVRVSALLLAALVLPRAALCAPRETAAHRLTAEISPAAGAISVSDQVSFESPRSEFVFTLHRGLSPAAEGAAIEELPPETARERYGINNSSAAGIYAAYRLITAKPSRGFTLKYGGVISHPPGEQAQEYSRSFSETPGTISADGCYLSGASGWYPHFEGSLVTFRLETALPAPYDSVAGGDRVGRKSLPGKTVSTWETAKPQDEITLTCGKYAEYSRSDGPLKYYAFLRSPDEALAGKYLEATGKYVGFYSGLIGAYPYGKFALVENFWDTGYGMPSFTLLGPKVIRLPFIINSSYPHEILHNWWGNGVFVDYEKGNWCEGLTAYLADYLIAENRGRGRDYRMTTLQKYSDYVSAGGDFPLTEFRSRQSSSSEAVGYGKAMMAYHMLRNMLGDENFKKGLRGFYSGNRFKYASFDSLRAEFEKITGPGRLKPFFDQWTRRAGAPALVLKNARVTRGGLEGYELEFTLAQTQDGPPYSLEIPAAIYLEGLVIPRIKSLPMTSKEETFHYSSPLQPVRLEIDPEFDIFRALSPLETPPTLSRVLGAAKPAIILPSGPAGEPWRALAGAWTKDRDNLPEISDDAARSSAPAGAYWVFGAENGLAADFEKGLELYGARFTPDAVTLDNRRFPRAGHTFVFAAFNPSDPAFSGALVVSGSPDKLPLLAAKLPHYGKYSWLVFDGAMSSLASGVWAVSRSPLGTDLAGTPPRERAYPARRPLAQLPSVFSAERMMDAVGGLAAVPGGRGPSSRGLGSAADTIEKAFRDAGLSAGSGTAGLSGGKPFTGDAFRSADDKPGRANIVGVAEGTKKPGEYLVLCAHYDHLAPESGAIFPGADDNASGVALLIELARHYAKNPGARSIIFAAFDGEERGRLGSKDFVSGLSPAVRAKINAALNFDTVGRLEAGKILVLGAGSSDKWVHIFRGAGFVTGSDYELVKEDLDSSDQASFIEAGIPAVQFFSGPKPDYHKASDTADRIDARGLVKQAEFALEIIDYLAGESDFITRPPDSPPTLSPHPSSIIPSSTAPRRASTGLVPDFAFQGLGVRALEITPGSPLEAAGIKPGDVIIKLAGNPAGDLRAYSMELKKFSPGQKISVTYLSDGVEKTAQIELAAK
ncbi:MAG: M28 family peptidase [Elusimicrobiota bacterium]|nr:M28 family peptidase [Elusimicrobiota bacterium]